MKKGYPGISALVAWSMSAVVLNAAHAAEKLPDGSYHFAAIDASGNDIGRSIKVDVPFNDPNVAVFALCGRRGAVEVAAKDGSGKVIVKTKCESR